MWSLLSWGSHPRNAGSPNSSIFHAVQFSLMGLTVHLPWWVCTRVCVCVESIFLANRLSNCWFPVSKSLMVLLFTVLAGKDIADEWFLLSLQIEVGSFCFVSPIWRGMLPSKQQSKKICRKMFIIQLSICLLLFWFWQWVSWIKGEHLSLF